MYQHQQQANGQWTQLNLMEQMANIGSEVIRALNWQEKNNKQYAQMAFERSLELFDLTAADPKNNNHRLKEILRAREVWVDYFFGDNQYQSTADSWRKYFLAFNYAARV
ncbi:MAG: hypothetical protein V1765_00565 [bacterium]